MSSASPRLGGDGTRRKHSARHRSRRRDCATEAERSPPRTPQTNPAPQQLSPSPSSTQPRIAGPVAPWAMVMDAITELRGEMDKLKADKRQGTQDPARMAAATGAAGGSWEGPPQVLEAGMAASDAEFSGFRLEADTDSEEGELHDSPVRSVLREGAKTYGPTECVSGDVDTYVADMVNHLFDHGMRTEDYKDVLEDDITKRPNNCLALDPVECNTQILEALPSDAKRADHRMKEVGKDILKAATILVKSLTVLDKFAQDNRNTVVAQEVSLLNGALALLGNANHRNNLVRRFVIKSEINHKYAHLCSDKVPMTRLLFGDDVSQSAKQIEETEKLKHKFSTRRAATWRSGFGKPAGGRTRAFQGRAPFRGFPSRFHPYGQRRFSSRGEPRANPPRQDSEPKNSRGRGHNNPRQ